MSEKNDSILADLSIESICEMIDLFSPSMDDFLYVWDMKKDYFRISQVAAERFHMPSEQFGNVVENFRMLVCPEDYDELAADLYAVLDGKKDSHNMEYRWMDQDRRPVWINCRGMALRDKDGTPHFLVGCINEIGRRQKADNVSGLLGQLSLKRAYEAAAKEKTGFILRIGIDDFRDINENMGIDYGDYVLRKTAECISENIGEEQQQFRVVADEFVIIDLSGSCTDKAAALYSAVCASITSFIRNNHYEVVYTISGGIFPIAENAVSFEDMMTLSEFALSEAKRSGKNNCKIFDAEKYDAYKHKKELNRILYHAVKNEFQGFEVYFQPLVNALDGKLTGAEALLRFHGPNGTMISPGVVIPILEESGLIIPVGHWILRQAADACREWQKYLPEFKVNVNLSYVQVLKSNVLDEIKGVIAEYGLSSKSVCIELTESGFLETNPHFTSVWNGLKEYGILLALDDFGTGYSNLHCLSDLKPAFVKLDRSFMTKALTQEYEYQLLQHVVEMAHTLGLFVCAEGIENEEELIRVRSVEPDLIQGYFFGRPCGREEFFRQFFVQDKIAVS